MDFVDIEVAILAGGASRRMGSDKARLPLDGVPIVQRWVGMFGRAGMPVVLLGGQEAEGADYVADAEVQAGPLAALAGLVPCRPFVLVVSCDIPALHPCVPKGLRSAIGEKEAAVPRIEGRAQPLCALYRADALAKIVPLLEAGERRVMRWFDTLEARILDEDALVAHGIAPHRVVGANTREEWVRLAALALADETA
ncbi:MAG: molybdenum cofactor guanylyltransferase [Fimbriimonadaceae bacterium]|nr:molybdenum cofactor guanylyltransferase [Fimbriimonadaceae bacterium]